MSRSLDDLTLEMRPLAIELIARCVENKIQVLIIDTLRTLEEQEANIRSGVSWTLKSKHLPQPPSNKSDAIDIAPVQVVNLKNWAPRHPHWKTIGEIGERLGLTWGGRWTNHPDMCHFQRDT